MYILYHIRKPCIALLPVFRRLCRYTFLLILLAVSMVSRLGSQDLSRLNAPVGFKIQGGINLTSNMYSVTGIPDRTSPFSWALSGSPTVQIGDIRFPFHFSFRDQRFGLGTPFNKFGVSPYYKWAKLHLGWRTMNFSPYSLQGKSFLGVGVELKPGKLRFNAFKGTLRNPFAQLDTLVYGARIVESYKRHAHGVKLGFGNTKNYVDVFYVKVKDDTGSLTERPPVADYELDPADNFVIGTAFKVTAFKKLELLSNLNISAYSDNQTLGEIVFENQLLRFINSLFVFNSSTQVSLAGDAALGLNLKNARLGLKYRRVEPQYRSLGISYIQSDVEALLGSVQMSMLKRKMIVSAKAGIERTDLRGLDYLGRRRLIRDIQLQFLPSKQLQVIGQLSNYQYETQDGLIELNDTLRIVNVTRQSGLILNYTRPGDRWQTGFNASIHIQSIRDQSPVLSFGSDISSLQTNISVKAAYLPLDLRCTPSVFYARYTLPMRLQERYGLGLSVQKGFWKKTLQIGISGRWANNDVDKLRNGHTLNLRVHGAYAMKNRHSLHAAISLLEKSSILSPSFNESRSSLSYGYRF